MKTFTDYLEAVSNKFTKEELQKLTKVKILSIKGNKIETENGHVDSKMDLKDTAHYINTQLKEKSSTKSEKKPTGDFTYDPETKILSFKMDGEEIELEDSPWFKGIKKVLDPEDKGHSNPYFWKAVPYRIEENPEDNISTVYVGAENLGTFDT